MAFDPLPIDLVAGQSGGARGDIMVRGAAGGGRLALGVSGQVLTAGATDPAWAWRGWVGGAVAYLDTRQTITNQLIPGDDTKPQSDEGVELLTVGYTPKSAASLLRITGFIPMAQNGAATAVTGVVSLYRDAATDPLDSSVSFFAGLHNQQFTLISEVIAGSTAATTFKLRFGTVENASIYINGNSSSRLFGGALRVRLAVDEFAP